MNYFLGGCNCRLFKALICISVHRTRSSWTSPLWMVLWSSTPSNKNVEFSVVFFLNETLSRQLGRASPFAIETPFSHISRKSTLIIYRFDIKWRKLDPVSHKIEEQKSTVCPPHAHHCSIPVQIKVDHHFFPPNDPLHGRPNSDRPLFRERNTETVKRGRKRLETCGRGSAGFRSRRVPLGSRPPPPKRRAAMIRCIPEAVVPFDSAVFDSRVGANQSRAQLGKFQFNPVPARGEIVKNSRTTKEGSHWWTPIDQLRSGDDGRKTWRIKTRGDWWRESVPIGSPNDSQFCFYRTLSTRNRHRGSFPDGRCWKKKPQPIFISVTNRRER